MRKALKVAWRRTAPRAAPRRCRREPRFQLACVAALLLAVAAVAGGAAAAGTLDRIGQEKTIRIAYREDAPPFSFKAKTGQPAGLAENYLSLNRMPWHCRTATRSFDWP